MRKMADRLYCFSPPVMIATFVIEICLALFTLWRYRNDRLTQVAVGLLVFLAIFQAAEFKVCGGQGLSAFTWSRIGFASIAMLPPLGIHLAYELTHATKRSLLRPAYGMALGFVSFFLLVPNAIQSNQCFGNYVIFQTAPWAGGLFGVYYYVLIAVAIWLAMTGARRLKNNIERRAAYAFVGGYTAFIMPTITVNILDPKTVNGIPSIMCGFAVIFALVLSFSVMPRAGRIARQLKYCTIS
jgi:hypothetical protein